MPDQELAAELDRLRRIAGFTLRDLVKTSGVPRSTLSDALSGRRAPRLETVVAIARACGADVDAWRQRWAVSGVVRSERRTAVGRPAATLAGTAESGDFPGLPRDRPFGQPAELGRYGLGGPWQLQGTAAVQRSALEMSAPEAVATVASRLGLADTGSHRRQAVDRTREVGEVSAAATELLASSARDHYALAIAARHGAEAHLDSCPEGLLAEALALAEQVRDSAGEHGIGGAAITVIALVEFARGDGARAQAAAIEAMKQHLVPAATPGRGADPIGTGEGTADERPSLTCGCGTGRAARPPATLRPATSNR